MELTTFLILTIANSTVLFFFMLFLSFRNEKKRRQLESSVELQVSSEEERLEGLSQDLIDISETLLQQIEEREASLAKLIDESKRIVRQANVSTRVSKTSSGVATVTVQREQQFGEARDYLDSSSKFKEIYYLSDRGEPLAQIARRSGKTKGEIQLILSLRKSQTKMRQQEALSQKA